MRNTTQSSVAPNQQAPGCLAYGLLGVAVVWISLVIGLSALVEWFTRDVQTISGLAWPFWASPAVALGQAALVVLAVGPLALLTRAPQLRAIYRTWVAAAGLLVVYGLVRALPTGWAQGAWLLYALIGLVAALLLRTGVGPRTGGAAAPGLLAGLLPVPLLALPWLIFGALGSPADTVLAVLAGVGVGLVSALLLDRLLLPPLVDPALKPAAAVGYGGLALGGALLILSAGAGFMGSNLLLLAALPPLGFGAMALAYPGNGLQRRLAPVALVGGAGAMAMAFFDPDELTMLLGMNDIPSQALGAVAWAIICGLLVSGGVCAGVLLAPRLLQRTGVLAGGLAAGVAVAGLAYVLAGQPGFYGERLFVILREQADLSGAARIVGREERLRFVYSTLTDHATRTQGELRAGLASIGARSTPYYLVNALEVDGSVFARLLLLTRPEVDRVLESPHLRPLPVPPPPEEGFEEPPDGPGWNITLIGADRVWNELGVTGEGIVIGQSDSGVDAAHPALRANYRGSTEGHAYNWFDPWFGTPAPRDYGMHGTHTLGSAAGAGDIGVAPDATWFACANLARNLGNPAHYLDCMQFMFAPHAPGTDPFTAGDPGRAAHVLNNSWGCPPLEGCDPESLEPATRALRAAGVFVVASAGNEGSRCASVSAPIAIYDSVLSVGAIDASGKIADFSSRGPVEVDGSGRTKPDIVAPGAGVLSAAPGGTYMTASGTSMAGPHVAGVVALMWQANPDLIGDIDRTERILLETARPYAGDAGIECAGDGEGSNTYGQGIVDAYAAVRTAQASR